MRVRSVRQNLPRIMIAASVCLATAALVVAVLALQEARGEQPTTAANQAPGRGVHVTRAAWVSVINDYFNGGIDHSHSCAALAAAIAHTPAEGGHSTVRADLDAYTRGAC